MSQSNGSKTAINVRADGSALAGPGTVDEAHYNQLEVHGTNAIYKIGAVYRTAFRIALNLQQF